MGYSPIVVRVFGVRTADACGARDGWREATDWLARSLKTQFGDQVCVEYVDLFCQQADQYPVAIDLVSSGRETPPMLFVGDELLSSGGKLSGPAVRRRLEALGIGNQLIVSRDEQRHEA